MSIDLPCVVQPAFLPLYLFGFAYLFLSCSVLTEDFFVPALERLAIKWRLSKDVAGATLMALGSSGPEIAVNVIDTVFGEEDLGILSVIGSALFNICFITSMSILFAPEPLEISWKPFIRDAIFYSIAILLLTIAVNDYEVECLEAFGLILLYLLYVCFLLNQHHVFDWIDRISSKKEKGALAYINLDHIKITEAEMESSAFDLPSEDEEDYTITFKKMPLGFDLHPCPNEINAVVGKLTGNFAKEHVHQGSLVISVNDIWLHGQDFEYACNKLFAECEVLPVLVTFRRKFPNKPKREAKRASSFLENPYHARKDIFVKMGNESMRKFRESQDFSASDIIEVDPNHHLDGSSSDVYHHHSIWSRFVHCTTCPIETLMRCTIPTNLYLSFVGCIFWILIISWSLTQLTKLTGCALKIDLVLMGMIFLAGGTSIPDMLCSIAVAKQLEGDMCISNISGSNISNVLLGIGLPWFIETLITGEPHKPEVEKLNFYLAFLVGTHITSVLLFIYARFKLKNWFAATLLFIYVGFVTYVIYIDLIFEWHERPNEESHSHEP